jgi:predicted phosphoribosyltransferase
MYYIDRTDLGARLAAMISPTALSEPIIVCLKESSLSTAISLAVELRAWIFPLLCEDIKLDADDRIIGVVSADGDFTLNPSLSSFEYEDIMSEYHSVIEDKKRQAFSQLNARIGAYGELNEEVFNGRQVILCADIIKNQLHIGAAKTLLKPHRPQGIIAAAGNVDVNAADYLRLTADKVHLLDVMSSMFDDNHYFEKSESYSLDSLRQIAMNISQFWKPVAA